MSKGSNKAVIYCTLAVVVGLLINTGSVSKAYAYSDDPNTIKLACNEFPPQKMENSSDGLRGFDVEFLEESYARAGAQIEIEYFPWKRALEYTRMGRVDGLCSCSQHASRDDWLIYSEEMGTVGIGVFYNPTDRRNKFSSIEDLRGLTVGVVRAYNLHQELIDKNVETVLVSEDLRGLRLLTNNRIDAFFSFRDTGLYILAQMKSDSKVAYSDIRQSPYFACFSQARPGAKEKADLFNRGFRLVKEDGTYDRIKAKYK